MEELDEDMIMNNNNNLIQEETLINKDNINRTECENNNVHNNKIHKKDVSKSKSKILPPNLNQSNKEAEDKNENLNILIEGINYLNLDEEIGKTRFPIAKIKNIMKLDDNTKLCQKDVYNLIGRATQLFIHELAENSYCITALNKRKTMNIEDLGMILFISIATAIKRNDKYSFINLKSILDENIMEEISKKEEKNEQKLNPSKEKTSEKTKISQEKKVRSIPKSNPMLLLADKNKKIDSFFQKK